LSAILPKSENYNEGTCLADSLWPRRIRRIQRRRAKKIVEEISGVVCGRLGEIYGHRKTYGFAVVMMAVGSLCVFLQVVFQLILFRFLQGVGAAVIQPSGHALAFKSCQRDPREGAGTHGHGTPVWVFVSPPIGGLIIDLAHWRFLLIVCAKEVKMPGGFSSLTQFSSIIRQTSRCSMAEIMNSVLCASYNSKQR
jgi:hypothetical protein